MILNDCLKDNNYNTKYVMLSNLYKIAVLFILQYLSFYLLFRFGWQTLIGINIINNRSNVGWGIMIRILIWLSYVFFFTNALVLTYSKTKKQQLYYFCGVVAFLFAVCLLKFSINFFLFCLCITTSLAIALLMSHYLNKR